MEGIERIVPGAILYSKNFNDDIHRIYIIQKAPVTIPATYKPNGEIDTKEVLWSDWGNTTSRAFKINFNNTYKDEANPTVKFFDNYKTMNNEYKSYWLDKDSELHRDYREKCIKQIFGYKLI
jgi:hypothetical protein